jgi:hypothetical protein
MKINQAMVCLECSEVSLVMTHCPVCLSMKVSPLSTLQPSKNAITDLEMMRRAMREMLYELGEDPLGVGA